MGKLYFDAYLIICKFQSFEDASLGSINLQRSKEGFNNSKASASIQYTNIKHFLNFIDYPDLAYLYTCF